MTLCDTGPMVALINRGDADHARCVAALPRLRRPLLTTWPCITEAMYLLGRYGGSSAQEELWAFLTDGLIGIHINSAAEQLRMRVLMRKYTDTPMDLADASLVAAAEALNEKRIFTIDSDFYVYRIADTKMFEIVP